MGADVRESLSRAEPCRGVVFLRDEGGVFDAPVEAVWAFVGSGEAHSKAHEHRDFRRELLAPDHGRYSWEQPFDGRPVRFTMEWWAYDPLGCAYRVLEGPFAGSTFYLYYVPRGTRTEVGILGEFRSPTLPEPEIEPAVRRFFATEFEQDAAALARHRAGQ